MLKLSKFLRQFSAYKPANIISSCYLISQYHPTALNESLKPQIAELLRKISTQFQQRVASIARHYFFDCSAKRFTFDKATVGNKRMSYVSWLKSIFASFVRPISRPFDESRTRRKQGGWGGFSPNNLLKFVDFVSEKGCKSQGRMSVGGNKIQGGCPIEDPLFTKILPDFRPIFSPPSPLSPTPMLGRKN